MLNSILYCRKWQLPEEMRRQECWKWQLTHRAFLVSLLLWTTSLPSFCSLSLLLCDYQGSNFLDGQFTVENLCIPILEERKKIAICPQKGRLHIMYLLKLFLSAVYVLHLNDILHPLEHLLCVLLFFSKSCTQIHNLPGLLNICVEFQIQAFITGENVAFWNCQLSKKMGIFREKTHMTKNILLQYTRAKYSTNLITNALILVWF